MLLVTTRQLKFSLFHSISTIVPGTICFVGMGTPAADDIFAFETSPSDKAKDFGV